MNHKNSTVFVNEMGHHLHMSEGQNKIIDTLNFQLTQDNVRNRQYSIHVWWPLLRIILAGFNILTFLRNVSDLGIVKSRFKTLIRNMQATIKCFQIHWHLYFIYKDRYLSRNHRSQLSSLLRMLLDISTLIKDSSYFINNFEWNLYQ